MRTLSGPGKPVLTWANAASARSELGKCCTRYRPSERGIPTPTNGESREWAGKRLGIPTDSEVWIGPGLLRDEGTDALVCPEEFLFGLGHSAVALRDGFPAEAASALVDHRLQGAPSARQAAIINFVVLFLAPATDTVPSSGTPDRTYQVRPRTAASSLTIAASRRAETGPEVSLPRVDATL